MYTSAVRQMRAEETRKKIIEAARRLIAANGFDNVSIGDIVKEAGVSTGSFYTYFKKKEDIVEELNKNDFYHLAEIVTKMEKESLIERLKYYSREFLGVIENTGIEICRQWVRNNVAPQIMDLGGSDTTKYVHDYESMRTILIDAVARKELREDAPVDDLALFINAEIYGLMIAWCMSDARVMGSHETDSFCDKVIAPALDKYSK